MLGSAGKRDLLLSLKHDPPELIFNSQLASLKGGVTSSRSI